MSKRKAAKPEAPTWDKGAKTYNRHMQSREVSALHVYLLCGSGMVNAHDVERLRFQKLIGPEGKVTAEGLTYLRERGEMSVTLERKLARQ